MSVPHCSLEFEVIFCIEGVASPLLANLYLHWFDALFYLEFPGGANAGLPMNHCLSLRQEAQQLGEDGSTLVHGPLWIVADFAFEARRRSNRGKTKFRSTFSEKSTCHRRSLR